jgi:hypothetical protein
MKERDVIFLTISLRWNTISLYILFPLSNYLQYARHSSFIDKYLPDQIDMGVGGGRGWESTKACGFLAGLEQVTPLFHYITWKSKLAKRTRPLTTAPSICVM